MQKGVDFKQVFWACTEWPGGRMELVSRDETRSEPGWFLLFARYVSGV